MRGATRAALLLPTTTLPTKLCKSPRPSSHRAPHFRSDSTSATSAASSDASPPAPGRVGPPLRSRRRRQHLPPPPHRPQQGPHRGCRPPAPLMHCVELGPGPPPACWTSPTSARSVGGTPPPRPPERSSNSEGVWGTGEAACRELMNLDSLPCETRCRLKALILWDAVSCGVLGT
jgi:hypothetical protein